MIDMFTFRQYLHLLFLFEHIQTYATLHTWNSHTTLILQCLNINLSRRTSSLGRSRGGHEEAAAAAEVGEEEQSSNENEKGKEEDQEENAMGIGVEVWVVYFKEMPLEDVEVSILRGHGLALEVELRINIIVKESERDLG